MPITVQWPSALATRATAWRLLDLSGMTKSVRESRNFTRAGYFYINGNRTASLGATVEIGSPTTIELRFPNGVTLSQEIFVVPRPTGRQRPRENGPTTLYRKG